MPKFLYRINYFNCIVVVKEDSGKYSFKKYHNVKNTFQHKERFLIFAKGKFPGAEYVNFYNKDTRLFIERIYLE